MINILAYEEIKSMYLNFIDKQKYKVKMSMH